MKRFLTIAALGDGTQASRLRKSNQPTTAGETPAYQRKCADTKLTIAAKAGVSYDVKLYKGLYVIPELDFALKGFNPDGVNYITFDKVVHMAYLQAPVMVAYKFRLKNNGNIVVKAGPYFACGLFGSKAEISGWGFNKTVDVFDEDYGFRRFDVGIGTGLAYERDHFTIGFEYSRGLRRLDPDFRLFNQTFGITLGYRL
jgi:hypothetical protein